MSEFNAKCRLVAILQSETKVQMLANFLVEKYLHMKSLVERQKQTFFGVGRAGNGKFSGNLACEMEEVIWRKLDLRESKKTLESTPPMPAPSQARWNSKSGHHVIYRNKSVKHRMHVRASADKCCIYVHDRSYLISVTCSTTARLLSPWLAWNDIHSLHLSEETTH